MVIVLCISLSLYIYIYIYPVPRLLSGQAQQQATTQRTTAFFFDFAWLGRLPWRLCKGQLYRRDSGRDFSATPRRQGRVVDARYWKTLLSASAAMDT